MSSGGRLHIPFPRTYLSLNVPLKRSGGAVEPPAAPEPQQSAHAFLSNRPASVARHASVSSVSSVDSVASAAPLPAGRSPSASPVLGPTLASFIPLNTKYAAPPKTATEMSAADEKHGFLSNRH